MSSKKKIADGIAEWHRQQDDQLKRMLGWCESPIEQLFLLALLTNGWSPNTDGMSAVDSCGAEFLSNDLGIDHHWRFLFGEPGVIIVQAGLKLDERSVRIDFAMLAGDEKFAVELDGHDFHERTKQQAQRDKSRDRALTKAAWKPLRFTGSEVYADADGVVGQLFDIGMDALRRELDGPTSQKGNRR